MGFLKLLQSFDELLYEIMSWLVFFPVTLWRTLRHPAAMMAYADRELGDAPERQYTDTLSPPLFLFLALVLSHGLELAVVGDSAIVSSKAGLKLVIDSDTNLLILRALMFSLLPLVMATQLVRQRRIGLDRETLRAPFFSQCFVAAPFALVVGAAGTLSRTGFDWAALAALVLIAGAFLWYGILQIGWFARTLGISRWRALVVASQAMLAGVAALVFVGWLFR